jgi:hypothetical protein
MLDDPECHWFFDFEYNKCLELNCSWVHGCLHFKFQTDQLERSDMFKKLIGNYELFD